MEKHEQIYRELMTSGYKGWGGENHENRIKSWQIHLKRLFTFLHMSHGNVVEFGCGAGDVSIELAKMGFDVTGVDISPTAVEWAIKKASAQNLDINFISDNICDESILENQKFDLVIDGNCLHCLFAENRQVFYRNAKRVLKDNGHLFISTAVRESDKSEIPKISAIERCILPEEALRNEIETMGFTLVEEWITDSSHRHYYGICKLKSAN